MRKPNQDPKDPHDYVQIGTGLEIEYSSIRLSSGLVSPAMSTRLVPIYQKVFVPCRYCKRYDEKVEYIEANGIKGVYHVHCAARVIQEAMMELAHRMKS
jgi:hypothetical protein